MHEESHLNHHGTSESSVTPSAAAPKDKTLNVLPCGDHAATATATAGDGNDARHCSAPINSAAGTTKLHIAEASALRPVATSSKTPASYSEHTTSQTAWHIYIDIYTYMCS